LTTDQAESDGPADDLEVLDLPEARRRIAALLQANQPLPDDLHERTLRLELEANPFDINLTTSLISLLCRLGRPPLPDLLSDWAKGVAESATTAIDELQREAVRHAETGDISRDYACLWQMVVRYRHSARGWAEFARRFAERREWTSCRLALSRSLACPHPDTATAQSILAALAVLALNEQVDGLDWRDWIDRLPNNLAAHPAVANLMLWTGNLARAVSLLPSLASREPPEADSWIAAANIAYEQENWADAFQYWRRAFDADLHRTLRSAIVDYSSRFARVLEITGGADELADWLTAEWERHRGVNLIPPLWCPESEGRARKLRDKAMERGLPSILLAAQGKSASASVGNLFSSGFLLAPAVYSLIDQSIVAPWLADYLRGGACYTTHLNPTERNIALLAAGGAKTIIVHVRDPRQYAISVAGHILKYPMEMLPSTRLSGSLHESVAAIAATWSEDAVGWIDGWVSARDKLPIEFTTFEEFVRDRDSFVERCLSLYGGDRQYFDRNLALREHEGIDYHRRSGRIDEWRELLTAEQVDRINRMIPDRLWNLFGWEP
jgi:hypothetical protein